MMTLQERAGHPSFSLPRSSWHPACPRDSPSASHSTSIETPREPRADRFGGRPGYPKTLSCCNDWLRLEPLLCHCDSRSVFGGIDLQTRYRLTDPICEQPQHHLEHLSEAAFFIDPNPTRQRLTTTDTGEENKAMMQRGSLTVPHQSSLRIRKHAEV